MDNIRDKEKIYLDRLSAKFNKQHFCEFIVDLLNLESADILNGTEQSPTSEQYRNYIETAQEYAKYTDNKRNIIGIIIVKLKANKNPANARTLQRNYIAHLLDYYNLDAALSAIYSDTDDSWRLSFVKKEISINVGKIETKLSPAKRYSYLFGKEEPNHTAKNQLFELLKNNEKKYSIDEIEEQFSVEKVTKDFFEKYKENYLRIKEMLEKNEDFISESKRCDFTSEEFTKKLMGQLVFLYFLQKKGWLGVPLVPQFLSNEEYNKIYNMSDVLQKKILDSYYITHEGRKRIVNSKIEKINENKQELEILSDIFVGSTYDKQWGKGQKRFVRKIFDKAVNMQKNFFDDFLEPFFYEGLNSSRKNQYFGLFNSKIPFLNGGLFEPLDGYNWKVAKFRIDNSVFSNEDEDGILDFFERYNFTINEEEPLEKEIAVDPEMLGKIFENLLDVKDRKSKGAFYTPREIVHYMCQESLANFLANKVNVDYNEAKDFIKYGEMIRDEDMKSATKEMHLLGDTIFNNITAIDRALEQIKIADPAVGSGAFPLGMLNEIVKLRDIITSYMILHNRLGLFGTMYLEEQIYRKRSIYNIKWNTIKNCIYAVDVENSAVDITKLRLWLSIVVDQNEVPNEGPQPLPNLDCKIMQGNSLIDEFNGIKLIDEELIEKSQGEFIIKAENKKNIDNQMRFFDTSPEFAQLGFYTDEKRALINALIKTKNDLFGTKITSEKQDLLDKIKSFREELFKVNLRGSGSSSIEELLSVDKGHNKPYFSWKLEFIEVFIENGGFDIIIGNPPYVDSEHMVKDESLMKTREYCNKKYKSAKGNWDLFIVFVELGYNYLNENGNVSFIIPNKIIASNYAKEIRKIMSQNSMIEIRDYSNVNVFKEAAVYPITFISNKENYHEINSVRMVKMKNMVEKEWENIIEIQEFKSCNNWDNFFAKNSKTNEVIKKIMTNTKLNDIALVKGAATVSEAYIVKEKLFENNNIKEGIEFKFLNTGTIDRYKNTWDEGKTQYIKQAYYSPVINKSDLNEISQQRYIEAESEKIIIGGMTKVLECYYDDGKCLAGKSTVIVYNSKMDLKYIIGILNSKLMTRFYQIYFNSLSLAGGFYRIGAPQIKELPIAESNEVYKEKLIQLVEDKIQKPFDNEIDKKIDELVYKIYGLNNIEIDILEEDYE